MAEVITLQGELALDPEINARCEERLWQAQAHAAAGFYHWVELGKLHAANKAELGPRRWAPWCRDHSTSHTYADHLINIATRFEPILDPGSMMEIQIDYKAVKALASPSLPSNVAQDAIARAQQGEHISKAEAQKMVAEAEGKMVAQIKDMREALENAVAEGRAKQAEEMAEEIAEARQQLVDDEAALQKAIKEIERRNKEKPDIRFIEEAVMRNLGIKRLSDRQWRALAQLLGQSIAVGRNKVYEPIAEEEVQQNLGNLKISSKITEAIQSLAGAPPADAVHLATWPVQRKIHRRAAIPAVQEWLADYYKILEQEEE